MKRAIFAVALYLFLLSLSACGGGGGPEWFPAPEQTNNSTATQPAMPTPAFRNSTTSTFSNYSTGTSYITVMSMNPDVYVLTMKISAPEESQPVFNAAVTGISKYEAGVWLITMYPNGATGTPLVSVKNATDVHKVESIDRNGNAVKGIYSYGA